MINGRCEVREVLDAATRHQRSDEVVPGGIAWEFAV
jgi:hypothetical protein